MNHTRMKQKIDVVIIRPYGVCGCSLGPWLSTIWDVLRKYEGHVRYHVRDTTSPEAKQFGITYRGIIVAGARLIKYGSAQELDRVLQNLIAKQNDT
ncbi:MAG: hypothetical protein ACE5R6_12105 [Candidatus Heimdallarchaeota archaeon]